jgi:2-(1,2-epoxy-1,2-dihydrophenyl)acetyl-CoA isomerase
MRLGLDLDFAAALDIAAASMPIVRSSEDHKEAVAAFKEKRTPNFKGR